MPKHNQIPRLHSVRRPNGELDHYWKPTRKERALGYSNLKLDDDYGIAIQQARAKNKAVAEAAGRSAAIGAALAATPPASRVRTVRETIREFEASGQFLANAKATRKSYTRYLRLTDEWTTLEDGSSMPLTALTRDMLIDLRDKLNLDPRHHRRVAWFATLGVFLQYCDDKNYLRPHPGRHLRIVGAPKRKQRILREHLSLLVDAAQALGFGHVAAGVVLGFYTMQREGDLLAATGFKLQQLRDISPAARAALAGPDGKVLGLFLQQEKTQVPVGIPLIAESRAAIEATLGARGRVVGTHLIPHPSGAAGACPDWRFQRDFRPVVRRVCAELRFAAADATALQDHDRAAELEALADFLEPIQFRDLRRSGMCWMRDLGVPVPLIAAISGHSIEETQKILDTYMPRDTRAAAEGMAMAVTRQAERDAADLEELG